MLFSVHSKQVSKTSSHLREEDDMGYKYKRVGSAGATLQAAPLTSQ